MKNIVQEQVRIPLSSSNSNFNSFSRGIFENVKDYIQLYATNPLFSDPKGWIIENPYERPIRPKDLEHIDFSKPLKRQEILNYSALAAQRMLLNIYESDLLFLPKQDFITRKSDFDLFYSNETKLLGELIRPTLEAHAFNFLNEEINISGRWSLDSFKSYFQELIKEHEQSESAVTSAILSSHKPQKAATLLLIQFASDYLSEASAMARNVLGNYGQIQSELFKILIDEYGYGVHATKHSTLFEDTMLSSGLVPQPHTYWQFYLASSLALTNYFHYVSRDHSKFFRYIGSLLYTETTLVYDCKQISNMLRAAFSSDVNTRYFDEHVHIDRYHGRMVVDNLIEPVINKYGDGIIEEIVLGVEEFRLLVKIADNDFISQMTWVDQAKNYKALASSIHQKICAGEIDCPVETLMESQGELSVTHLHNEEELLMVESGEMEFVMSHSQSIRLKAGEGIVIPPKRLHGSVVVSDKCVYRVYTIKNYSNLAPNGINH